MACRCGRNTKKKYKNKLKAFSEGWILRKKGGIVCKYCQTSKDYVNNSQKVKSGAIKINLNGDYLVDEHENDIKKCICPLSDLMRYGCRCGGE